MKEIVNCTWCNKICTDSPWRTWVGYQSVDPVVYAYVCSIECYDECGMT